MLTSSARNSSADEDRQPADRAGQGADHRRHHLVIAVSVDRDRASGAGRRALSLTRSSSAMTIQLATSEEPPADRNGVVRPVSGIRLVTPPTTMNTCSADDEGQAAGEQPAEDVAGRERRAQAALDEDRVEQQQRHQPGEAELLADGRDDEVGLRVRDEVRGALADARCRGRRRRPGRTGSGSTW